MSNVDRSNFNADERAQKRASRTITLGGKKYHPRKRTGTVTRELIEASPDAPDKKRDEDAPLDKERSLAGLDSMYDQLIILLRDEAEEPPEREVLEAELDMEDAEDLMDWLMPERDKDKSGKG